MIVNSEKRDTVTSGNFKTSGFKIEASAKAFQLLSSNVYQHKVRAVIREIACNALDANTESGSSLPPVVHLPTPLEQWFSVRDNGPGLSEDHVREIFTVYFCSTKTGSNDYIGKYGLGSKSPYCLVDSFIVKSVHDGIKYSYSAYQDEDGLPQMALLTQEPTLEPTGLEVIINVQGRDIEFREEAVQVFKYFDIVPTINLPSVVLEIEKARKFEIFGDGFAFNTQAGQCKAVMGNVAYAIPYGYGLDIDGYIRFDIGSLDFDLGRESLTLDDKTRAAIKSRIAEVKDNLADHIAGMIEKEPTFFKKAVRFDKINCGMIGNIIASFPDKFNYRIGVAKSGFTVYHRGYRSVTVNSDTRLPLSGVEYYRFLPKFGARIKAYLKQSSLQRIVLLSEEQIKELNIDEDQIKDLNTLPKVVYNRQTYKQVKVRKYTGYGWIEATVDTSVEYVYVEISRCSPVAYSGTSTVSTMLDAAKKLGVEIDTLYGVSKSFKKIGAGIELTEYLSNEIAIPDKALLRDPDHKKLLSKIDDRFKKTPLDTNLAVLYNRLGKVEHDTTLDELSKKYVDKYPLMTYLQPSYYGDVPIKAIQSYIQKLS